jgi:hypothetical protein
MKIVTKTLLIGLLGMGVVLPAMAGSGYGPNWNQEQRIEAGLRSGQLTVAEARILRNEQAQIRNLQRNFLRDGRLNQRERRILEQRREQANRHIYRLAHNDQRRNNWRVETRDQNRTPWDGGSDHGYQSDFGHGRRG